MQEADFTRLADQWEKETLVISSITQIVGHPAYQEILKAGPSVIPFILERMKTKPGHWFAALYTLSGEDAASGHDTVQGATEAWLEWGARKDLVIYP